MRKLILVLAVIGLSACSGEDLAAIQTGDTTTSKTTTIAVTDPGDSSFSIPVESASVLTKQSGGSIMAQDASNSLLPIGDTSSSPKRAAITFPIAALAGKVVTSAYLALSYESDAPSNEISLLGLVSAFRIPGMSALDGSAYGATELGGVTIFSSASQYAVAQQTKFQMNIQSLLQDAIQEGETHLTVKIRFANEQNNGMAAINFYGNTASEILEAQRPRISGTFY